MNDTARHQAQAQLASIKDMLRRYYTDDELISEAALVEIQQDPLEVSVRSGWQSPYTELEAEEFRILLCTGGPAVRIVGDLDCNREPIKGTVRLEYQDRFTQWASLGVDREDEESLYQYATFFFPC